MVNNGVKSNKNFASKFGFIMAAAGSAIGLGNIWNFSYKLGHYGGGAFLVTYLFMVFAIGIVIMVGEMFIGQRAQTNIVESFKKIDRRWMFVGFLGIIVASLIATYYIVIGGWTIFTAFNSFNSNDLTNNVNGFFDFANSGFLPILLAVIFLALTVAIISLGVMKGIERFSKIVMPVLLVLLITVMIRSLTLGEGVADGLKFMFHVDFAELGLEGFLAAMGQAFYSMSLGMGIMVTYGSYTKKNVNLAKSAILIALLDTLIAIIAGLAIFPAVFAFDLDPTSGIGLMFATIPQVFAAMGDIGMVFSFIFFLLIFIAAITSMVSIFEVVISYFTDKFKSTKLKMSIIMGVPICIVGAIVSLSIGSAMSGESGITIFGNDLLTFFDDITNKILMPIGVICTCLVISISLKTDNVLKEMQAEGVQFKLYKVWASCIKFVTPVLVAVVLIAGIVGIISTTYGIFTVCVGLSIVAISIIINQVYAKRSQLR